MRAPLTMLLALALGVACAGLVACGAKDNPHLLSAARADRLSNQLDKVQAAVDAHACDEATQAAEALNAEVSSLPSDTDPALERRLQEGAQNLTSRAAEECQQTETTETQTQTEPPPTETATQETQTTETQPTQTETAPSTQTQTTTTPPETTPPESTTPDSGGSTVPQP